MKALFDRSTYDNCVFKQASGVNIIVELVGFDGQFHFRYILGHLSVSYKEMERSHQLYSEVFNVEFWNWLKDKADVQWWKIVDKLQEKFNETV